MADSFRYPFKRSNNYLGAFRLLPSTKAALPILEDMQFEAAALGAISADLTATESADTLSSSATLTSAGINADLAATEGADTLTSSAAVAIQSTLGRTEAADTLSSSAVLPITASLNATEGADTAAGQAVLPIQAAGSTTEAPDTLTASAQLAIQASLSQGEQPDTVSSTASIGPAPVNADLVATEAGDTLDATATLVSAPQIEILDGAASKALKKVEQARDKWDRDLRRIIENAFDDKTDLEIVETPKAEIKEIAKVVYVEADLQGMAASMARIEALIAEYIRHEQEELEEEEAVMMLLLAA